MRAVKLILTACGFAMFFMGMIVVSALTTSAAHWAFYSRLPPASVMQD
jgi:hypothetical protein